MEFRYEKFAATGVRNITGYNQLIQQKNAEDGENRPILPFIVVIVDELADLMMVASNEVEDAIIRLAQMARAAGIHMILATQLKCGCHYRNHQSKCPFSNGFCSLKWDRLAYHY